MSVYNRKGGSGKAGTLRQQFNYYKRKLENRLISEQAFKEARGVGTIEARINTLFKNLNYDTVFKQGITRKVGSRTVRFVGSQAVEIQIQSLRQRASKAYQTEQFITNYIISMQNVGFSEENILKVERMLESGSIDKLTLLIDKGVLPSIQFVYSEKLTEEELVEEIKNAVKNGVTKEELQDVKHKQKELVRVIKAKSDILGW